MLREQRTDALKDLNSLYKPKKCFLPVSWYNDSCYFCKSEPLYIFTVAPFGLFLLDFVTQMTLSSEKEKPTWTPVAVCG